MEYPVENVEKEFFKRTFELAENYKILKMKLHF